MPHIRLAPGALEAERVVPEETPVLLPSSAAMDALAPLFTGTEHIRTISLEPSKSSLDLLHDQMTERRAVQR